MKKNRRVLSFLLALVLALSMLPVAAMAAEMKDYKDANHFVQTDGTIISQYLFEDGSAVVVDAEGKVTISTNAGYKEGTKIEKVTGAVGTYRQKHAHEFGLEINRDGHFYSCACGARGVVEPHIDPKNAVDGRCTCGYKFMSNADLTVLWMSGMTLSPRFSKNKTEYVGKLHTYRDITETKISAFSFDARATVELPEDLTIQKGTNKFEIKVTAEDGVTTKTYTVTVEKE